MKPLFSEKYNSTKNITLIVWGDFISDDIEVAETMTDFFADSILNLNISYFFS